MNHLRRLSLIGTVAIALSAPSLASASAHPRGVCAHGGFNSGKIACPLGSSTSSVGRPVSRPPVKRVQREHSMVAASYTLISGTAVSGVSRWPSPSIGYWWSTGGSWKWGGYVTTAGSTGNYSFSAPTGYYYYVEGAKSYPCSNSGGRNLWGNSASFFANGTKVNAQVTQNTASYYGSGCP
jgi:hypothetical protein